MSTIIVIVVIIILVIIGAVVTLFLVARKNNNSKKNNEPGQEPANTKQKPRKFILSELTDDELSIGDSHQDHYMDRDTLYRGLKTFWRWFTPITGYAVLLVLSVMYWDTPIYENLGYGMVIASVAITLLVVFTIDFPRKRSRLKLNEIGLIEGPFGAVHGQVDQAGTKWLFFQKLIVFPKTLIENPATYLPKAIMDFLRDRNVVLTDGLVFVVEANHIGKQDDTDPNGTTDELEKPQPAYWVIIIRFRLIGMLLMRFLKIIGSVKDLADLANEPTTQAVQVLAGQNSLKDAISNLDNASRLIRSIMEYYIREPKYDPATGEILQVKHGSWCVSIESVSVNIYLSSELTEAQKNAAAALANKRKTITDAEAAKQKLTLEGEGEAAKQWAIGEALAKVAALGYTKVFEAIGIKDDVEQKMLTFKIQEARKAIENNSKFVMPSELVDIFSKIASSVKI